jgi:hypothetical protein
LAGLFDGDGAGALALDGGAATHHGAAIWAGICRPTRARN